MGPRSGPTSSSRRYTTDRQRLRGFAKITRDLTARRKVEELQRSERRMNEFLAMLAHELRNPLAPIQSALDVARAQADDGRSRTGHARSSSARRAPVTTGGRPPRRQPDHARQDNAETEAVDVKDAIAQVLESLHMPIQRGDSQSRSPCPRSRVLINADAARMAQVLSNIIGQRDQIHAGGGHISVDATRRTPSFPSASSMMESAWRPTSSRAYSTSSFRAITPRSSRRRTRGGPDDRQAAP